jgi:hypothetical protein
VEAWKQIDGPQAAAIELFGLELKQGLSELRALLVLFLFNPANQKDDPPYGKGPLLYQEEAAAARQPVLDRLIRLKEQALPLIAQVDACTEVEARWKRAGLRARARRAGVHRRRAVGRDAADPRVLRGRWPQ